MLDFDEDALTASKATLWQAYTLLTYLTKTIPETDDLHDIITALLGVKSLMDSGLILLEEVV